MAEPVFHPAHEQQERQGRLFDQEIEENLLASIVKASQLFAGISWLAPECFYFPEHQVIWECFHEIFARGRKITFSEVKLYLENNTDLGTEEGKHHLMTLAQGYYTTYPVQLEHYANIIRDLAITRQGIAELEEGIADLKNRSLDLVADEKIAGIGNRVNELLVGGKGKARTSQVVGQSILEDLNEELSCYSTGIRSLDSAMGGGLFAGKAFGICARKKDGKTVLAASISDNLNHAGVKHLFIAGEMGSKQIQQRMMARRGRFNENDFRSPDRRNNPDFKKRISALASGDPGNIVWEDRPGLTFEDLKRVVSTHVVTSNITGFVLDYFQLVGGKRRGENDAAHFDRVAQWIAQICGKHQIWALVTAQLNQGETPNIRGGEGIRMAFDQVYFLHRPDKKDENSGPWLEMVDSRYTPYKSVGSKTCQGLRLVSSIGPYFKGMEEQADAFR